MSKETAAAILTRVYYDKVHGAENPLHPHLAGIPATSVDEIGKVYAGYLQKLPQFEKWASNKDVEFVG